MSETTNPQNDDSDLKPVEETPIEETPAVAGGHDDSAPEQGEGEHNSY